MKLIEERNKANTIYQNIVAQLYGEHSISFVANDFLLFSIVDEKEQAFLSVFQSKQSEDLFSFGNFQCTDSQELANNLFDFAVKKIRDLGGKKILGPMHGNSYYSYRFTDNFGQPFASEMQHKAYYPMLWKDYGFTVVERYFSSISAIEQTSKPLPPNQFADLEWRDISAVEPTQLLKELYDFSNCSFSNNPLFEPISFVAFCEIYRPVLPALSSPLCQLVYDAEKMVGLFFSFPDAYREKTAVVKTLARLPDDKYKGLASEMGKMFVYRAYQLGFRQQIHAYFHEENRSKNVSQNFGGEIFKTHLLYSLTV